MSDPFSSPPESRLADPRYRAELLSKVEALLSVMEAARGKVLRNLEAPGGATERLRRILGNLERTLEVCRRARATLLHAERTRKSLPAPPRRSSAMGPDQMSPREYAELTFSEYRRFKDMGPITREELENVDLDSLCWRF